MAKKNQLIKCAKCGQEFPNDVLSEAHKDEAFVSDEAILCKDCLIMAGGNPFTGQTYLEFQKQKKTKQHDW